MPNDRFRLGQTYRYIKGHEFEGILRTIGDRFGKNIIDNEIMEIKRSDGNRMGASATWGHTTGFSSFGPPQNSWICFHFKKSGFALSHYTLKARAERDFRHGAWTVEGSNDWRRWTTIDTQTEGDFETKTFACSNEGASKSFRLIRLHQAAKDARGVAVPLSLLPLNHIELFGSFGGVETETEPEDESGNTGNDFTSV
jgi:hypothetical protein